MTNGVLQATDVVKSYNKKEVLHSVSLTIEPGKIYGLIGRNGAGKTTLLSILTAQNTHDSGLVTYNGERVWENQKALDEICFSRELSPMLLFGQNTLKVKEYLRAAALYYPHWDKEYAARLIEMFGLDTKKKIYKLSKGMMSMVTIVLALASRAPITILDEPVAGLDVVAREQFYDVLLADYAETGRTFIISTHIIEEAAGVFEDIIFYRQRPCHRDRQLRKLRGPVPLCFWPGRGRGPRLRRAAGHPRRGPGPQPHGLRARQPGYAAPQRRRAGCGYQRRDASKGVRLPDGRP